MATLEKALFSLDQPTADKLRIRAALERRPKSAIVRDALSAYFGQNALGSSEKQRLESFFEKRPAAHEGLPLRKAIAGLRSLQSQIAKRGIAHVHVFGSVAREEATPESDIDVLIDVKPDARFSLFDLAHIQRLIEDLFNCKVDVVTRSSLYPDVKERAIREAIRVF